MNSLVTIEEYDKSYLAQVAVLALEQAGIQCFLQNETIVAMDWFMANAVGGIRLQVAAHDPDRDRVWRLLRSHSHSVSIDGRSLNDQPYYFCSST